jgi:hypothetical protein
MGFLVGVSKETFRGATRVALVPAILPQLAKAGMEWGRDELFSLDKTQVLFGDAKTVIGQVSDEISKLPFKEVATA